jgi:hypothetical protein
MWSKHAMSFSLQLYQRLTISVRTKLPIEASLIEDFIKIPPENERSPLLALIDVN